MVRTAALLVLFSGAAPALEFAAGVELPAAAGVKFRRCLDRPSVSPGGARELTLVVVAEGTRRVVVIPEIDGAAQKGVPAQIARGKPARVNIAVPEGAQSVSFRCAGEEEAFLGLAKEALAALPELPAPPAPALPELPDAPAAPPPEAAPAPPLPLPEPAAKPTERVLTARREEEKPPPPPVAAPQPAPPPAMPSGLSGRFTLVAHAGAARSSERFTAPATLGHLGAELAFRALPELPILLAVDWRASKQGYMVGGLRPDGRNAFNPEVDEQRTDLSLSSGWDFGPLLVKDGRLTALPTLGVRYVGVRNGNFPVDLFGIEIGARLRFALSPGLTLLGGASGTLNVMKKKATLSAVGRPTSEVALHAGLALPLAGGHALELLYVGDILPMAYDTRVAHGASVGVRSAF